MRRSDRRLLVAIGTSTVMGLACLAVGIWGLLHPPAQGVPYRMYTAPAGAVVAGVGFLGFALGELVHRARRGPEVPGRHTRADEEV